MRAIIGPGICALLLLCPGDALGQSLPLRARVERVILRDLGLSREDSNRHLALQFLAPELRVPEQASLRLAAVHAAGAGDTWLLRMECGSRRECIPFEVVLRGQGQMPMLTAGARPTLASVVPGTSPLVRGTQKVKLTENISGLRLSTLAVCLQSGSMGQKIRVRNVSTRKLVMARVCAAGQVVVED